MDVVDLREFYASRLGITTRRMILSALQKHQASLKGQSFLGMGFAVPYLDVLGDETAQKFAFMQARQGVIHWPEAGAVGSALVDECDLPLLESSIDVALVIHGLELTDSPQDMLAELWRVLAPQGRLLLVVPNRRGMWARFDSSPFGYGQPFSKPQLARLLRDAQFSVNAWSQALYFPPADRLSRPAVAAVAEGIGCRVMPALSGVIIVEAVKQVYAIAAGKRVRRLVPRLQPAMTALPAPGG